MRSQLQLIEIKPGVKFSLANLQQMLPDAETLLFFGKVYDLDYRQLSSLMAQVLQSDLAKALFHEGHGHSSDLQDYLVDVCAVAGYADGELNFSPDVPKGEVLPEVWKMLEVEVAKSIKDVAAKLESVVAHMPGKQGQMLFQSMMKMNAKRPTIGDYRAHIHHAPQKQNLVILDVSGSMSAGTIKRIVDDVVALSYEANADMAIVSTTCTYWTAGSYDTSDILNHAEYAATCYEELEELMNRDWGTVVTIADYDSSMGAKQHLASNCNGHIDLVLDMSLVNRPTFLAECVGQFADEVRPLLIATGTRVLNT